MAVPNNYIDKIKKDGDSRMISPAADMVRVNNENFEGSDLDKVLDEVAQAIEEAGEGGYAPPAGGIPKTDLASDVQTSLGKADTALQSFTETDPTVPSWAKQPTKPTYTAQEVGGLPANTPIPTKTSDLTNDSGFVTETDMESAIDDAVDGLGGEVSVTTNQDGTFVIHVGDTDYTINLNHTHENMAKIVKCTEATKPATMDNDTIYVQVDNATTPTEIECLYLFGIEFAGGGVPDTGQPLISRPANGSSISLGKNMGSGVSKTITIKGKNLTGDLTVTASTGLSLTYGQSTGSSVTIPLVDALLGVQVTVEYNTVGGLEDGSLLISHNNIVLSAVTVFVEALLPSEYTQLEYISNCVKGIDTGILATDSEDLTTSIEGSSWELDVRYDSSLPSANQMLVAGNEDIAHWAGYINDAQKFGLSKDYAFSAAATVRQVITFTFWSNKITTTSNGQNFSRNYTYHNHRSVCLFNNINATLQQYAGFQYTGRIYSAKCVSGGSFNGIPAERNSDNHFGLYDIENNVFYDLSVAS